MLFTPDINLDAVSPEVSNKPTKAFDHLARFRGH